MIVLGRSPGQEDLHDFMLWQLQGYDVVSYDIKSWFEKPHCILKALELSEKVIWLDNDIEIVNEKFFDILDAPALSAARDGHAGNFNTGVIIAKPSNEILNWASACDARTTRGDQEVFPEPDFVLSNKFNSLRLDPYHNPYAIHHTGAVGKATLRKRIKCNTLYQRSLESGSN